MFKFFARILSLIVILIFPCKSFTHELISKDDIENRELIYDCIEVSKGQYCEKDVDLIVNGPANIEITRFYNSNEENNLSGWRVFPYTVLLIGTDDKGEVAYTGEHTGSILPYIRSHNYEYVEYKVNISNIPRLVNNAGAISGQTNYKNNLLKQIDSNTYLLISGDGSKRIYKNLFEIQNTETFLDYEIYKKISNKLKNYRFFQLDHEILSNGNKRFYFYDKLGRLKKIESKNKAEKNSFGWINISYEGTKITFLSSDKQIVEYFFETNSTKHKVLKKVKSSKNPEFNYSYDENDNLIEKKLPMGAFLKIKYDSNIKSKDFQKVLSISIPSNKNKEVELYNFKYRNDQLDKVCGTTEVIDFNKTKICFEYDNGRIGKIEFFLQDGNLYKLFKRKWDANNFSLIGESIEDNSKKILSYKIYFYDANGNVIEEKLYGNLTGKNDCHITLDKDGFPKESDCYVSKNQYSEDGFNLLLSCGDIYDNGIEYEYVPNTNLLSKKFIYSGNEIKKRFFYKYDENGTLIKTTIDDGKNYYISKEDKDISKALITEIIPKKDLPNFGYPETVLEKYLNLKDHQTYLLKKTVNSFDDHGNIILSKTYDANDNLAFKSTYKYDYRGNLISQTDRAGNETEYLYDLNNNVISMTTNDITYTYQYDHQNHKTKEIQKFKDGSLQTKSREYDILGNLINEIDILGNNTSYEYDSFSRLIKTIYPPIQDENGKKISVEYKYEYDIFDNTTKIIDPKNYVTLKKSNIRNQITEILYPDNSIEKFAYDLQGTLHRKLQRDGTICIYQYDYQGRKVLEEYFTQADTGPGLWLGDKTYEYDAFDLKYFTDSEKNKIRFKYDYAGRMVSKYFLNNENKIDDNGPRTDYSYDSWGRVISEKIWFGSDEKDYYVIRKKHDVFNNVIEEITENSSEQPQLVKTFKFDNKNNLIQKIQGESSEKIFYDSQNQIISIENTQNDITHFEYDYSHSNVLDQKVLTVIEKQPNGNKKIIEYDDFNKISSSLIVNSLNQIILKENFYYDSLGNLSLKKLTNFCNGIETNSFSIKWFYGPMGRLEKFIEGYKSKNEKETRFEYNKFGQITKKYIPGILKPITYEYGYDDEFSPDDGDIAYRPTLTISYPEIILDDGKITETDNALSHKVYFDSKGKIIRAESPGDILIQRTYKFDALIKEKIGVDKKSDYSILYKIDRTGRIIGIKLPDKSKIEYQYDGILPKKVARLDINGLKKYFHKYDKFDKSGNLLEETLIGDAGIRKNTYVEDRKTSIRTNSQNLQIDAIDSNSNILKLTQNEKQSRFSFDPLDQLTNENSFFNHSYKYDSFNNIMEVDNKACLVNDLNQLIICDEISCEYDPRGMLFKKTDATKSVLFINNAFGNLTDVVCQNNYIIGYSYDIFGRRLLKKLTTPDEKIVERYIYAGNQEIGIINKDSQVIQLQVPGAYYDSESAKSVAFELADKIYVPLYDFQNNVISLTDFEGNLIESYEYSIFGGERILDKERNQLKISKIGNPWRFATKRKDDLTGLVNFGLRDYDPEILRWTNPDPSGFLDGINKYAFVQNNPLKYQDILGLSKHHYYVKYDNFDDYFYHSRTEDYTKGSDPNLWNLNPNNIWSNFTDVIEKDLALLNFVADNLLEAANILDTGIGIIEIAAGLAGLGSSGGFEFATLGAATAIAIPVASGSLALIADGAVRIGIGNVLFRNNNDSYIKEKKIEKNRKRPGRDRATSKHIIESIDGETNSITHQVTKDGKIIHQHQKHIGKYGSERQFPDEWVEYPNIKE